METLPAGQAKTYFVICYNNSACAQKLHFRTLVHKSINTPFPGFFAQSAWALMSIDAKNLYPFRCHQNCANCDAHEAHIGT